MKLACAAEVLVFLLLAACGASAPSSTPAAGGPSAAPGEGEDGTSANGEEAGSGPATFDGSAPIAPSWKKRAAPTVEDLRAVHGVGGGVVVAVGDAGTIVRSTDDGRSWSVVTSGTTKNLTVVNGSSKDLTIAGEGVILRSTDGGVTWTEREGLGFGALFWGGHSLPTGERRFVGYGCSYAYCMTGGTSGADLGPLVPPARGNATWQLYAVWMASPTDVFAGVTAGIIYRTSGAGWAEDFVPAESDGYSTNALWGTSPSRLYAVGHEGIIRQRDASGTWTKRASGTTDKLRAVTGTSSEVFVVGDGGYAGVSSDGIGFTREASGATLPLAGAWTSPGVARAVRVVAVGAQGTILVRE